MIAKTHNLIAFTALVAMTSIYTPDKINLPTFMLVLVANIIGSLLPDIDQASNRLWDLLPGGEGLGKIIKNIFGPHRTLSHSILGVMLTYKISYWLLPRILNPNFVDYQIVINSLMIGIISHLAADGITEEGLPIMFPLRIKFGFPPIKSWRIKTGKWFENLVIFPGTVIVLSWLIIDNWQILKNLVMSLMKTG